MCYQPMTVAEVQKALADQEPDAPVYVFTNPLTDYARPVGRVRLEGIAVVGAPKGVAIRAH